MTDSDRSAVPRAELGTDTRLSEQSEQLLAKVAEYRGVGHPIEGGDLFDWVLNDGRTRLRGPALFDELCWRMTGKGIPLWRATFSTPTLHPQFLGYNFLLLNDTAATE